MSRPGTQYAKGPEGYVGYQVIGSGPRDLVFIPDWPSNIDAMWDEPLIERFLNRLASFSRLICFDRRGAGVSDPVPLAHLPTLEQWMDDVRTVMDAARSERTVVYGHGEGGPMAMLFAATYPEKTTALVLASTFARRVRAPDYPEGIPSELLPKWFANFDAGWGTEANTRVAAPSLDPQQREWYTRYCRMGLPPTAARLMYRHYFQFDLRPVLPTIRVPALVLHRSDETYVRPDNGRYLARHIPGAKYVELPGRDNIFYAGETDGLLNEVQGFLTGERESPDEDRMLATVMFVDIVGSTERAAQLGDRRWRELLESFYAASRSEVARSRGHELDTAGDGYFARFDGPARAIRCACAIRDAVARLGLEVRAGLHTGECVRVGEKVGGIAVHIGARVAGAAQAGEVLVSGTVKDLVVGSGLHFSEQGIHELKGVPGKWMLYAVEQDRR